MSKQNYVFGLLRIALGWIFFWAFIDKLFGLGFATVAGKSWLDGFSPTIGFLKFGTHGPFSQIFQSLAGLVVVDYLFMFGLLGLGLALLLGVALRLAAFSGSLLLWLMYLAAIPWSGGEDIHNPLIDEHLVYFLVLWTLYFVKADNYLGLGEIWRRSNLVQKMPWLK